MSAYLCAMAIVVTWAGVSWAADAALPTGSSPPAVELPHFPDRVHAFVWRNWGVVPAERLARVLETSADNVRSVAASMGLPPEQPLDARIGKRLYLTVIRRNWHLLPYEQLLALLDWTGEQLAYTLREDDFLWAKLGRLKPACAKLAYSPPTEQARRRADEIRAIVEPDLARKLGNPSEKPLAFLERFRQPASQPAASGARRMGEPLRFLYSYFAVYGDPLLDPALDPYPDGLLKELADLGVNGVWLHVVLRDLAPGGEFPEFGKDHRKRLENLRTLVQRARRFGIGVYLYMNEPRAMPPGFFKDRPDIAGVREGEFIAMCTSSAKVRGWLGDSLADVFKAVPDLGGVFTITGSENLTNCASHHNWNACPRCKDRSPAEIIAEVNAAIEAGVHRGSPDARVIVWDWGWNDAWAPDIIARLPKSAWLMSVSEWSLPLSRGGVKASVGEYSISAVGPGPRAKRHWELAAKAGLKCVAKVQVNNTWELSAVPYLPVMNLVAEHCARLADANVDGLMLSWSLGGYPSPNLRIAQRLGERPASTPDAVMDEVARNSFGPAGAAHARAAWRLFSDAFGEYPFDSGVIYRCPVQLGPANLLWGKATGYSATMVGFPYDDVKGWSGPYPPAVLARQFEKVAAGWSAGLAELERAAANAPAEKAADARREVLLARAAGLHFQSVADQVRFVLARDAVAGGKLSDDDRRLKLAEIRRLLASEAEAARELLDIACRDSRVAFEASNHYYYLPQDLVEKILNCRYLLDSWDKAAPATPGSSPRGG